LVVDEMYIEDHKQIYANLGKFRDWGAYGPMKCKLLFVRPGLYGVGIDLLTIDILMAKSDEGGHLFPAMKVDR
jgi:hypothetical protein